MQFGGRSRETSMQVQYRICTKADFIYGKQLRKGGSSVYRWYDATLPFLPRTASHAELWCGIDCMMSFSTLFLSGGLGGFFGQGIASVHPHICWQQYALLVYVFFMIGRKGRKKNQLRYFDKDQHTPCGLIFKQSFSNVNNF